MRRIFKKHFGQSTAEYAIIIGVVVAVVIAMQTYVKRGIQGRMRDEVKAFITDTNAIGNTSQYEPYYIDQNYSTTTNYDWRNTTQTARSPKRAISSKSVSSGWQNITSTPAAWDKGN